MLRLHFDRGRRHSKTGWLSNTRSSLSGACCLLEPVPVGHSAVSQAMLGLLLLAQILDSEVAILVKSMFGLQAKMTPRQAVRVVGLADELSIQTNFKP